MPVPRAILYNAGVTTLPRLLMLALAATLLPAAALAQKSADDSAPPPAPREFRGLWVATVANIDWPSKPGLSTEQQRAEAVALLDRAAELNLNVIVLQVRTSCDALYQSDLEPWSYYLTGEQGKAPEPFYDPLAFWIEQAHARGMELHAWFNPFRAMQSGAKYDAAPSHVTKARPDLVRTYGDDKTKYVWLDPARPDAREQSLAVFLDVVKRYDVDGVHIDDYFYPYPVGDLPFPDADEYDLYRKAGGKLSQADWRRSNINDFVERMYKEVKRAKPHVKVGISPFGIWQPGYPPSVVGFNQYDKLYADAKLWLNEGWCDYYSPQLYWPIASPGQSFPALLNWWASENTKGRTLAPGLFSSKRAGDASGGADELVGEVFVARYNPGSEGHVHFSAKVLARDTNGIATKLRDVAYQTPALVPATPWIDGRAPAEPRGVKLADAVPNEVVPTPAGPASQTRESAGPNATAATTRAAESLEDVEAAVTAVVPLRPTSRPAASAAVKVTWDAPRGRSADDVARYAVYARTGGTPPDDAKADAKGERGRRNPAAPTDRALDADAPPVPGSPGRWALVRVLPAGTTEATVDERATVTDGRPDPAARLTAVAVSAVDRCGNESDRVVVTRP